MTETAAPRPRPPAVFTQGSLVRHVLVMTSTGSIGLMAVFVVDLLSLIYVSWLGDPALTAGVGFASQVLFFIISVNIGLSIAVTAVVARSIGAQERSRAQRLASSGLTHSFLIAGATGLAMFALRRPALQLLGAEGAALEAADVYLTWTLPTNGLMAMGMVLSGVLRAVGDARRSRYVTLFGSIVTAVIDPFLILGLKRGVEGAAIAAVIARLVWISVGLWGSVRVHGIVGRPDRKSVMLDLPIVMKIALPAILTNLAAPIANGYGMRAMASFGEAAVAASAIIDRVAPVAFVVLFAMSGVVGPIVAQNHGAKLYPRVRHTLTACFIIAATYSLTVWLALVLGADGIVWLFGAQGETARLVIYFCDYGALAWVFLGCLFSANAAFNNLDFAFLSTFFNWGRATLGTVPFVALGAHYLGSEGVILGVIAGGAVFGCASMVTAYAVVGRIARAKA